VRRPIGEYVAGKFASVVSVWAREATHATAQRQARAASRFALAVAAKTLVGTRGNHGYMRTIGFDIVLISVLGRIAAPQVECACLDMLFALRK
jgi:hypothetical protein